MKIPIDKIRIAERIRKDVSKVDELAASIRERGLISPIAVMQLDGGEYQLLAGLRRIKAIQHIGEKEIDAKVFPASDAEEALRIEYAENEQREPFSYSEKMEYAAVIAEIERAKALERQKAGVKLSHNDLTDLGAERRKRETRSIVGEKIGMSGKQYDRARYIAVHASPDIIDELDRGERSIRGTYDELRKKIDTASSVKAEMPHHEQNIGLSDIGSVVKTESETEPAEMNTEEIQSEVMLDDESKMTTVNYTPSKMPNRADKAKVERAAAMLSPEEREAVDRISAFSILTPEEKIIELQSQLKIERCRAITAEIEVSRLKDELHNAVYHRDGIISNLERQLDVALARVSELEEKYESAQYTS